MNKIRFASCSRNFLMGYGASLALGCNISALLGEISSQSLHGWFLDSFCF
ncbi:YeeE/YedE thiosulfate transporter family protein [Calderihabitans maritimus]